MRRRRSTGLVLFWAAVVLLVALSAFLIATREVTFTTFLDTRPNASYVEVERRCEVGDVVRLRGARGWYWLRTSMLVVGTLCNVACALDWDAT